MKAPAQFTTLRLTLTALLATCAGCASTEHQPVREQALAATLRPHAAAWQQLLAAEDARAATDAELRVITDALRSAEPELRHAAVRALGRLERPELVDVIAPLLSDNSPRVRASAADALAQAVQNSGSDGVRTQLLAALATEQDEVHALPAISESLGRLRHPDSAAARAVVDRLVPYLSGADEARTGALRGLYFASRQPTARGVFNGTALTALRRLVIAGSDQERIRGLALATLVAAGGVDLALLESVLRRDASPQVRREAVAGAAALAEPADTRRIVELRLVDPSAAVRYEALRLYGRRLAAEYGCDPVVTAAGDSNAHVALYAADLLGGVCSTDQRSSRVLGPLVESGSAAAGSANVDTRRAAARALVALAHTDPHSARSSLSRFDEDDDAFVRALTARAAGVLQDTAALRRMAHDEHANVRSVAVRELRRTVGPAADAIYLTQLQQDDSELLLAASAALAGSTTPGATGLLLDALDRITAQRRETSRDARRALLERVQELGNASVVDRVERYLRDFDPVIAGQAADIVSSWTGTRPGPSPEPVARQPLPTFDEVAALERAHVVLELQGGGRITIRLFPFVAPTNAARFARLARTGYYDGLTMHRVVPNFVVQGGSPGANEYSGDGPFTRDELGLTGNWRGTVGLSTRGRDTGDAQFYINLIDNVRLDHDYTVFGVVIDGMGVVDSLQEGATIRRVIVRH